METECQVGLGLLSVSNVKVNQTDTFIDVCEALSSEG